MPKKRVRPSQDPFEDPEFLRFIREHSSEPIAIGGAIPKGHKGPYVPSKREIIEAIRFNAEVAFKTAQAQASIVEEQVNALFRQEGQQ
jgi:hypothetical protein